jgi:hypothetical protein
MDDAVQLTAQDMVASLGAFQQIVLILNAPDASAKLDLSEQQLAEMREQLMPVMQDFILQVQAVIPPWPPSDLAALVEEVDVGAEVVGAYILPWPPDITTP